jgi:hypothetical protein
MMKKIIALIGFGLILVLAACGGDSTALINEELEAAAATVTLFQNPVTTDVSFPSSVNGIGVMWSSDNPAILSNAGQVNRPEFGEDDAVVEVTGVFEKEGITLHLKLFATILALTEAEIEAQLEALVMGLDFVNAPVLYSQPQLPTNVDGVRLTYRSLTPTVMTNTAGFLKEPLGGETLEAVLRVTASHPSQVIKSFEIPLVIGAWQPLEITSSQDVEFIAREGEFIVEDGSMTIYTMNNDMPYVELIDFMSTISGAIIYSSLTFESDDTTFSIFRTTEPDEEDDEEPVTYYLTFDFANNTATTNYYSFFGSIGNATQTDFGRGLEFIDFESNFEEIEPVTFDLGRYNMQLFVGDEGYLVPFHLANLFLSGSVYDVYYNGDTLFGQDIYDFRAAIPVFHESSLNEQNMPVNLKEMSYHYMAFIMNYFFGLQNRLGIEDFYDVLTSYRNQLLGSDTAHYQAFFDIVMSLDDLHTTHTMNGPYITTATNPLSLNDFGPRGRRFYDALFNDLDDSRFCNADDGVEYLADETIALIHIGGFNDDATLMMAEVMAEIDAKSSIEKIIINLACNTGGIIGTAWQILGYLTDGPLEYYSLNSGDGLQSKSTFTSETSAPRNVEWYILTSPVTYSAANLFTSMAKDMGLATIVGSRSSGGAASIKPMLLPNGTVIFISSPNLLANNNFEDIEGGIAVDIFLSPRDLRDDRSNLDALLDAILNND